MLSYKIAAIIILNFKISNLYLNNYSKEGINQ